MTDKILTLLGFASKSGKIIFGTSACSVSIKHKKVKLVILAGDISENSEEKIVRICNRSNVPYIKIFDRDVISKAVGKSNKTVLGIVDNNFSKKILEYVDKCGI